MPDIYDQHKAAFARVSAYVILKDGERVATVAIKYPADGAGRLYGYTHVIGLPMTRGSATGGNYDKRSAAVSRGFALTKAGEPLGEGTYYAEHHAKNEALANHWRALADSLDRSDDWTRALEKAGYTVLQAV